MTGEGLGAAFSGPQTPVNPGQTRISNGFQTLKIAIHKEIRHHAANFNKFLDTTLDLEHPEVLVYEKMPAGTFQLNGVEFLVPISAWKSTEPPRIMGQALTKADSIGFWYLHVWTWKPSPSGLFAPWNPDVKCIDGSSMQH